MVRSDVDIAKMSRTETVAYQPTNDELHLGMCDRRPAGMQGMEPVGGDVVTTRAGVAELRHGCRDRSCGTEARYRSDTARCRTGESEFSCEQRAEAVDLFAGRIPRQFLGALLCGFPLGLDGEINGSEHCVADVLADQGRGSGLFRADDQWVRRMLG